MKGTRLLIYKEHKCCGFGNLLGGLAQVRQLARVTNRTLLIDYPILHNKMLNFGRTIGLDDAKYRQLLNASHAHTRSVAEVKFGTIQDFHFKPTMPQHEKSDYIQRARQAPMSSDPDLRIISIKCPRSFLCVNVDKVVAERQGVPYVPLTAIDLIEHMRKLMAPEHLRDGFRGTCKLRLQSAGLEYGLLDRRSVSNRTLVVFQARFMVDSSVFKELPEAVKLEKIANITRSHLRVLRQVYAEHEIDPSQTDLYVTSDNLRELDALLKQEKGLGRLLMPSQMGFEDSRLGNILPLCDWWLMGEADYAVVTPSTFGFSATMRSTHTLAYNGFAPPDAPLQRIGPEMTSWR